MSLTDEPHLRVGSQISWISDFSGGPDVFSFIFQGKLLGFVLLCGEKKAQGIGE